MKRYIGIGSILIAMTGVVILTLTRENPTKNEEIVQLTQVTVSNITSQKIDDIIIGHGQVSARWQTTLASEVTGRVLKVSEKLLSGAQFKKGDVLAVIDATTYKADLASAKATFETARRTLKEEQQHANIAADNWETSGFKGKPSNLVLRKPQLREAKANIESAASTVRKAEYNLAQTKIVAPYDGVVLERTINPGDMLQMGAQIAQIYDRTIFEVHVPLNNHEIARLRDDVIGSPVTLIAQQGQKSWHGKVARMEQSIDAKNRWQNVIVEIIEKDALLPGAFVTTELSGQNYDRMITLPEYFVGNDGMVWFVDTQNRLQKFAADILFQKDGSLFIFPPENFHEPALITPARDIYLAGVKVTPVIEENGQAKQLKPATHPAEIDQ